MVMDYLELTYDEPPGSSDIGSHFNSARHYTFSFYLVEIFGTFENNFRNSFPRFFVSN
jgi:hypothetical protein